MLDKTPRGLARMVAVPLLMLLAFLLGVLVVSGGDGAQTGHSHGGQSEAHVWTCSMHPQIRAPEPGACPICGMDLIVASADAPKGPANEVVLSESAKIRAKIQTTAVKRLSSSGSERRLLGRVDYDETRLRTVTSWIGGRIDRLHVRTTGQKVSRGQVIATMYSPEVFGAQQDLLVAKQQVARLAGASDIARSGAETALEASRERLRLLGVTGATLAAMEEAKRPSEKVRIRSPFAGTVIERLATEGSYVKTGTGLFQIADLSRLWVQLDAYESDLPLLAVGQPVGLTVEALPGQSFEGRVTFVDPVLNQRTRTTRVRIEVRNATGQLRPGMFAEAVVRPSEVDGEAKEVLVIPETAPLFTGRRSLVYVEKPAAAKPTYEARVVTLGPKSGDLYPVLAGLGEGEQVVTHGAFTLDADLQIRGGKSMMTLPDDTVESAFDRIVAISDARRSELGKVVSEYLVLHEALASDALGEAKKAAAALITASKAVSVAGKKDFAEAWAPISRQLQSHGALLGEAQSLDAARTPFRDISQQVATVFRVFGNPTDETVRLAFCPMALGGEGAEWMQRSSTIENPYFGASMHTCGDIHQAVEHGTFLPLGDGTDADATPAHSGGHQH